MFYISELVLRCLHTCAIDCTLFLLVWSMWELWELISDAKPGMLNVVLLSRENEGMHHLTALMQHYHL